MLLRFFLFADQVAGHHAAQIVLHAELCLPDGLMDGPCIGGTVGFDDRLCRAQEGGSAVFVGVHALFEVGHAARP